MNPSPFELRVIKPLRPVEPGEFELLQPLGLREIKLLHLLELGAIKTLCLLEDLRVKTDVGTGTVGIVQPRIGAGAVLAGVEEHPVLVGVLRGGFALAGVGQGAVWQTLGIALVLPLWEVVEGGDLSWGLHPTDGLEHGYEVVVSPL